MSLGKKLFIGGGAGAAACPTDSVQPFGVDSAYSSNVALYQLDSDGGTTNNVPDTVGNHNGTATSVTYSTGKYGNAAVFNGSAGTQIEIPDNNSFSPTNNPITVSMWVKTTSTADYLASKAGFISGASKYEWGLSVDSSGNLKLECWTSSGSSHVVLTSSANINDGNWHHVAFSILHQSEYKLYADGVNVASTSSYASYMSNTAANVYLGARGDTTSERYTGSIDQVRFFDRVLSGDEISILYNETTDTVSDTNVLGEGSGVALYSLDYDASDAGGNYDGTPTDVTFGVDGQINWGASFNGSSSKITLPNVIDFATGGHTISAWVYITDTTTSRFISNFYSGTIPDGSFDFVWIPSSNSINVDFKVGGSNYTNTITNVNSNEWIHIAATFVSNGTCTVYKNGTSIDTVTAPSFTGSSLQALNLGYYARGVDYWSGKIDQVRIFKKALSPTEVSTLYGETACVYTSTTDIVDYQGTNVAYYKLDNNALDETSNNYDGTESNITYEFGRYGQAAVFNGSNSIVKDVLGSGFTYAGKTMTFSAWIFVEDASNDNMIIGDGLATSTGGWGISTGYGSAPNRRLNFSVASAAMGGVQQNYSSVSVSDNTWTHIAVSVDFSDIANSVKMYINGTEDTSITEGITGTFVDNTTYNTAIGGTWTGSAARLFEGKIDQVRMFDSALDATAVENLYNEKPEINTSNFETALYEGNGGSQYVSNVGFEPDLVWIKSRGINYDHQLHDSVRGAGNGLLSNSNVASVFYNTVTSFDSNGFFVNAPGTYVGTNADNQDFVAWCWKAGGDAVNNTNGNNITSQVSANQDAGFSIVKWTGTGNASHTVGHGLDSKPELIIHKKTSNPMSWFVVSSQLGNNEYLTLTGASKTTDAGSGGVPSSVNNNNDTTFGFRSGSSHVNNVNENYRTFIAYCFHSVAGYQKVGSYNGSGSSGKVVTTGFKPKFLMIKNTTTINTGWIILDAARGGETQNSNALFASLDIAEWGTNTTIDVDFTSTGFIIQNGYVVVNSLYDTYIYLAIA